MADMDEDSTDARVKRPENRHSGAMRSIEPGISRFRVWPFGPSRNDGASVSRSAREGAAVLFLSGGDHFELFVGTRYRRAGSEDVPLVLDLVDGECCDRIHLVHQLMIGGAEVT